MRWKSDDVRIVDFGIAKLLEEDAQHLTQTGEAIGTPFYMSPEQCNGLQGQDPATDIYAIACVMHECLSGQPPFRGTSAVDTFTSIYKELPKPLTSTQNGQRVPPLLEASILKGLEKDPKRRHLTAAAFQRSIIEALDKGKEKEALQYLVGRAQTRMNRLRQRVGENQLKLAAATIAFTIGAALLIAYKPEIRDALHKALSPTLHSIYMRITFSKNTFSKRQWRKRAIRESPIHPSRAEIHCRIFTSTSANEASGMSWTHWQKGSSFFGNAIEQAQKGDLHLDNAASLKECLS